MIDITHKNNTLRIATAQAVVKVSSAETIKAVQEHKVPKGDVFEMAKAAGLLGVKKTPDLLPDCHPLPIEHASVTYEVSNLEIRILMHVKTIYKTGVEVEAMHGASIVALTIYDMLKPIDNGVEIREIKLLEKKGGKSDFMMHKDRALRAAVVVCSDSVSAGKKEDRAGKAIVAKLEKMGVTDIQNATIPDEAELIKSQLNKLLPNYDLIIFTGGTGLSPRDVTADTIRPLLEREIEGVAEAMRDYGQQRTPYAMLSRSVAGMIGKTLVMALPGSTGGATESMDAVFPALLHVFDIVNHARHD